MSDFWSFALGFYARPGIPALCLRLQAEGGTDILLLIAHCRGESTGAPLTPAEIETLRARTADWRARAVLPLRALRVDLRGAVDHLPETDREAFRDRLKQVELAAEKVQAGMIADWLAARIPEGKGDFLQGLHLLAGAAVLGSEDIALLRQATAA